MSRAITHHVASLQHDRERFERFVDLMATIMEYAELWGVAKSILHGGGLAARAHDHYLPAVRDYLEYTRQHGHLDPRKPQARVVRARLASNARWMYAAQRPVFNLTLDLLTTVGAGLLLGGMPLSAAIALEASPLKRHLQEQCWLIFKHAEQRWLAEARR
jgi:hypothetical protein